MTSSRPPVAVGCTTASRPSSLRLLRLAWPRPAAVRSAGSTAPTARPARPATLVAARVRATDAARCGGRDSTSQRLLYGCQSRWSDARLGRQLPTADVGYPVAQLAGPLSGGEIARPTGAGRPKAAGRVAPKQPDGEPSLFLFRFYEAAVRVLTEPAKSCLSPVSAIGYESHRVSAETSPCRPWSA